MRNSDISHNPKWPWCWTPKVLQVHILG